MSWQGGNSNAGNNGPGGSGNSSGFRRNSYHQSTEDGEIGEEEGEIVGSIQPTGPNPPQVGLHSTASSLLASSPPPASLHRGGSNSSLSTFSAPLYRSFSATGSDSIQNRGNRAAIPSGFTAGGAPVSSRIPPPLQQQSSSSSSSSSQPPISRSLPPQQQLPQQPRSSGPLPPFGGRPLRGRGGGLPPRSQSLTFQRPSAITSSGSTSNSLNRPDGPVRSASFTPATTVSKRPTDPRLQQQQQQTTGRAPNFVPSPDRLLQPPPQQPPPQQQSLSSSYQPSSRGSSYPGSDRIIERSVSGNAISSSEPTQSTTRSANFHERSPAPQQQPSLQQHGGGAFRSPNFTPAITGSDSRPPLSQSSLERRSSTGDRSTMIHHLHHHHHHQSHNNNPSSTTDMGFTVRQSHHHHHLPPPSLASSSSLDRGLPEDEPVIPPLQQHSSYSSLADSSPFPIPKKRDNEERFASTTGDRVVRRAHDGRGSFPPGGSGGSEYTSRRSTSMDLSRDSSSMPLSRNTSANYDYYSSNSSLSGNNDPPQLSSSITSRPPHGRSSMIPHETRVRDIGFGSAAIGSAPGRPPQHAPSSSAPQQLAPYHWSDPRYSSKLEPSSEPVRSTSGDGWGQGASGSTSAQPESLDESTAAGALGPDRSHAPSDVAVPSRGSYPGGEPSASSSVEPPGEGLPANGPQPRSPTYRKMSFRGSPLPPPLTSSQLLAAAAGGNPSDPASVSVRRPSIDSVESGGFSGGRSRFGPPLSISSSPSARRPVLSYSSLSPSSSPRKLQQLNRLPPAPSLNLVVDAKEQQQTLHVANTVASTSAEPTTENSSMSNASSMALSKPPTPEIAKPIRKPPLLTSALGQSKSRAEEAIILLKELMSSEPNLTDDADGIACQLPAKDVIMTAMNQLNSRIEEVQSLVQVMETDFEETQNALKAKEAERIEKEQQEHFAAAEKVKQQREKEEEEKRKKEEDEARKKEEFLRFMERKKVCLEEELEKEAKETENRIAQIKESDRLREQKELDEQIGTAASKFEKDLAKARRELNRAEQAATKAEVKVATMEAEFRSKKKEQEEIPQEKETKPETPSVNDIVSNVLAENQRRAAEAHLSFPFTVAMEDPFANLINANENMDLRGLELATDPKHNRTNLEWSILARQVTGPADAFYTEPSEAPYFEHNERTHEMISPLMKECIRDRQRRLEDRWKELAEEYYVRKQLYGKQSNKSDVAKKSQRSMSITSRKSIFGDKVSAAGAASIVSGNRNSSNPYRRARRGNEVRSEYEQEQIIAEIAAKEAMEKRIAHGGSYIPRQIISLEKELTAVFIRDFEAQRIHDPMAAEEALSVSNVWSDMEKAIFLDRFLQYPKDFRKIATFLRNKTAKDCVAFYYDSKQTVPYKTALKEHIMRRKRRGDYPIWDATVQAAISVGANVTPGTTDDRLLSFELPEDESTYFTHGLHPLKLKTFETMIIPIVAANAEVDIPEKRKSRKQRQEPLFVVDPSVQKLLRSNKDADPASMPESANDLSESVSGRITPVKRMPQKWTLPERKLFSEAVTKYGKDWSMLVAAVGTKSLPQIKNYYYDYKKQSGKRRSSIDNLQPEERRVKLSSSEKLRRDNSMAESSVPSLPDETTEVPNDTKDDGAAWIQTIEQPKQQQRLPEEELIQSNPGAGFTQADIWAQVQQQALLQSQQQQQQQQPQQHNQLSVEDALRLLQHHNQTQQQQQQQQLLSWLNATQAAQAHAPYLQQQQHRQHHPTDAVTLAAALAGNTQGTGHTSQEWGDVTTQMQNFLALRQGGHHAFGLPSASTNSHLSSLALAGLGGLSHLHLDNTTQPTQQRTTVANETGLLGPSNTGPANAVPHGFLYHQSLGNHDAGHSMPGSVLDVLGLLAAAQARPNNTRNDNSSAYHHHPYNLDGSNPDGSDRQDNY